MTPRGKSERILNAALAAGKEAMWKTLQDGAATNVTSLRTDIDDALARVTLFVRDVHKIGMLNVVASCITLLAAAIALWATR